MVCTRLVDLSLNRTQTLIKKASQRLTYTWSNVNCLILILIALLLYWLVDSILLLLLVLCWNRLVILVKYLGYWSWDNRHSTSCVDTVVFIHLGLALFCPVKGLRLLWVITIKCIIHITHALNFFKQRFVLYWFWLSSQVFLFLNTFGIFSWL